MLDQPAETTAETPATVREGLGYPNDRQEVSPQPTGWQGLDTADIDHVHVKHQRVSSHGKRSKYPITSGDDAQ